MVLQLKKRHLGPTIRFDLDRDPDVGGSPLPEVTVLSDLPIRLPPSFGSSLLSFVQVLKIDLDPC